MLWVSLLPQTSVWNPSSQSEDFKTSKAVMIHNIRGLFNSLSVSENVDVINKYYFLKFSYSFYEVIKSVWVDLTSWSEAVTLMAIIASRSSDDTYISVFNYYCFEFRLFVLINSCYIFIICWFLTFCWHISIVKLTGRYGKIDRSVL